MALHSPPRRHRTYCGSPHQPSDMGWVQGAKSQTRCGQPPESPEMATVALARFFTQGTRPLEHKEPAAQHTVISPTAGPGSKRAATRHDTTGGFAGAQAAQTWQRPLSLSLTWDSPGGRGRSVVLKGTVPPWVQPQERGTDWSQWHPPCHPSYGDERTHTTVGHEINTSAIGN